MPRVRWRRVSPSVQSSFLRATETCQTVNIDVDTGPLTLVDPTLAETRPANINLGKTASAPSTGGGVKVTISGKDEIQIRVTVNPVASNVACYMTDSSGNFLLDVNGDAVTESGSNDGIFAVIVNPKNIEVATNPGQFYFNFVYWNQTADAKTVSVNMPASSLIGVVANGRNAVHSALFGDVFNPSFQASFECANDGSDCYSLPWGATGTAGPITVPPQTTLLVTYHLEWAALKKAWPLGCNTAGVCTISVTGNLTGGATGTCEAGATGYRKQ